MVGEALKDRTFIHHDSFNNNDYLVRITEHMLKKRKGDNAPRGRVFKSHGQIARLLQYAIINHSLDEFEGKGPLVIEYTYKGRVNCLVLKVKYSPYLEEDVVSEIILISAGSDIDLNAKALGFYVKIKNRINMRDYDLKTHDYYSKNKWRNKSDKLQRGKRAN